MWSAGQPSGDPRTSGPGFAVTARTLTPAELGRGRARDQFAALLPIRERVQGPEHSGTLAIRHELAYWTRQAGNGLIRQPAGTAGTKGEWLTNRRTISRT